MEGSAGAPARVLVGTIRRPIGLRGEVVIEPTGSDPGRFLPGRKLLAGDDPLREITIRSRRPAPKGGWVVSIEGVGSREAAEALRGRRLWVDARDLPSLPAGELYHYQVLGLMVLDAEGVTLGRVESILQTGSNDVYCVGTGAEEILIPAVGDYIADVDLTAGVIRLAVPRSRLGMDEPPI